ncbi:MAG: cupin [Ruthenibacterium sp.]
MKILEYAYEGEGLTRVYENSDWMVGIKNWKPANDITGLDCLERHNKTDEFFILLAGNCTLLYANDENGTLKIDAVKMEPMKVYNIPATLWHNTVTQKDTKMVLVERPDTSMDNSEILSLSAEQLAFIKTIV